MKKNPVFLSLFLSVLFQTCYLFATAQKPVSAKDTVYKTVEDTAKLIMKLNGMSNTILTLESEFIQEKHLSFLTETIITKGYFTFKKKNLIRWEYVEPFSYIIVIKENSLLIKDENKISSFDMSANKSLASLHQQLSDIFQGNIIKNKRDYSINYMENSNYYLVNLNPKSKTMKEYLNSIEIYFDKTDLTVSKIKINELLGDYSVIKFFNKKMNNFVADEKFALD